MSLSRIFSLFSETQVLFFASARSKSKEKYAIALEKAEKEVSSATDASKKEKAVASLERLKKVRLFAAVVRKEP